jgi:hypothetical protein
MIDRPAVRPIVVLNYLKTKGRKTPDVVDETGGTRFA